MSIIEAEEAAKRILANTGSAIPVDLEMIAEAHNIQIRRQVLEDAVSGMLVVKDTYAIIGINEGHHPNRQRFTIAHELGHFFLHRNNERVFVDGKPIFYRDQVSSEGSQIQEIEANAFAAELLMPASALKAQLSDRRLNLFLNPVDDLTVQRLALELAVSVQALTIRLTRLNLVEE